MPAAVEFASSASGWLLPFLVVGVGAALSWLLQRYDRRRRQAERAAARRRSKDRRDVRRLRRQHRKLLALVTEGAGAMRVTNKVVRQHDTRMDALDDVITEVSAQTRVLAARVETWERQHPTPTRLPPMD